MKKGDETIGKVIDINFGDRGIVENEAGEKIAVSNVLIGQKVRLQITKKKKDRYEGKLLEVLEKGDGEIESLCPHFDLCGGCTYQNLDYSKEIAMKANQVKNIMLWNRIDVKEWLDPISSPLIDSYRNKMEFSFGNEQKDGEITLGMHKRASMYDIVPITNCQIVDEDFRAILTEVLNYCQEKKFTFYHKINHVGFMRHLVIRKGINTGEILINIVTSSEKEENFKDLLDRLLTLKLKGTIKSVIHTINNRVSDIVAAEKVEKIYGEDYIYDEVLGLRFKISPFSFFQTNTLGAEKLYSVVKDFVGDSNNKVVYDLYCGTGTIGMIVASNAKKVIGIEIVKEAIDMANENKKLNNITNATFIADDVKVAIKDLANNKEVKPDIIILDPPRDGINPDALKDVISFNVNEIVYVSCNPKSLARDLVEFQTNGYVVEKARCVDMFPRTTHVETIVKMERHKPSNNEN